MRRIVDPATSFVPTAERVFGRPVEIVDEGRAVLLRERDEAVKLALRIVDDHFGFNPQLGTSRYKWAARTLADHGELARLIAWYAR